MNKLDKDYLNLCQEILDNGVIKSDRTGTGTKSIFGKQFRHKMSDGFPLLTTKKMSLKNIATELRWFLNGDTNIKFLVNNGCNIWNGDCYKNYLKYSKFEYNGPIWMKPEVDFQYLSIKDFICKIKTDEEFAKKWGELGPIYGKQWRNWEKFTIKEGIVNFPNGKNNVNFWDIDESTDQIANLINDLKNNPDSRRLMVNAWNVGELDKAVLPPCHYGFQIYTRKLTVGEREEEMVKRDFGYPSTNGREEAFTHYNIPERAISLMWSQRSVDTALGLPYNIASYAMLLTMLGNEVNMVPDELIGNLGDTHLYLNHLEPMEEQIGRELTIDEKIIFFDCSEEEKNNWFENPTIVPNKRTREPFDLPTLNMLGGIESPLDGTDFEVINYVSHPAITFPLSN